MSRPTGPTTEGAESSTLQSTNNAASSGSRNIHPPQPSITRPLGSIRPSMQIPAMAATKAIGNMAAVGRGEGNSTNVTRQGAPKMTFLPNHPVRRKIQSTESTPQPGPSTTLESDRGRGRGRGRGAGPPGAGRGRGEITMVASGPFALGPASLGTSSSSSSRRPNHSFSSVGLLGPSGAASLGAGLSGSAAPALKKELRPRQDAEGLYADEEILSDEEGAEKVDMDHVSKLDWSAPVALRKRKDQVKRPKKEGKGKGVSKNEDQDDMGAPFASSRSQSVTIDDEDEVKDEANALDLSESEEEEELEDLVEHFTRRNLQESGDEILSGEQLYFFQFPSPFPTFKAPPQEAKPMDIDSQPEASTRDPETDHKGKGKAVSWAPDVKNIEDSIPKKEADDVEKPLDGVIGQLEVYRSGTIKMKLGTNVLMEVSAATQPTFLMQAVHVDSKHKRMMVVGEISKKFIVSPDVDKMLEELTGSSGDLEKKGDPGLEGLEAMDTAE